MREKGQENKCRLPFEPWGVRTEPTHPSRIGGTPDLSKSLPNTGPKKEPPNSPNPSPPPPAKKKSLKNKRAFLFKISTRIQSRGFAFGRIMPTQSQMLLHDTHADASKHSCTSQAHARPRPPQQLLAIVSGWRASSNMVLGC